MTDDKQTAAESGAVHSLGRLLRRERDEQCLALRELARLVGTSASNVMLWERDETVPTARYLTQLARVLEISTEDLHRAAGIDVPHDAASIPAMLRAGYDDLPPEAVAKIERYVARTAREYGATKKTTNKPTNERRTP